MLLIFKDFSCSKQKKFAKNKINLVILKSQDCYICIFPQIHHTIPFLQFIPEQTTTTSRKTFSMVKKFAKI